jgi:mRNA interferase YafQ
MKTLSVTNAFKKDAATVAKRGYNRSKLDALVRMLVAGEPLPARCRAHKLSGNWNNLWECHGGPNWLLIYEVTDSGVTLHRTGTHSDLF